MNDEEIDKLLNLQEPDPEVADNIKVIKKILDDEEKVRLRNAKYYDSHKDQIYEKSQRLLICKLCDKTIKKGSYTLHKKSVMHQNLLKLKLATIEEAYDDDADDEGDNFI